jgi:perosamine synthetase
LYGMIIDWDAARRVADELGAPLIEDAAQAHGSNWRGRPVGSTGDMSILSFGRGKGWTGSGGGALLARGAGTALIEITTVDEAASGSAARVIAAAAQWLLARPALYALPASIPALGLGETIYHEPSPTRGMTAFSAALALATDDAATTEAGQRVATARAYLEGRVGSAAWGRVADERGTAGALRLPLRVPGGWSATRETEAARLGAGPPYPATLAELPALLPLLRNRAQRFPVAEMLVRELITLPTHGSVGARDRARLERSLPTAPEPVARMQQAGSRAEAGSIVATGGPSTS